MEDTNGSLKGSHVVDGMNGSLKPSLSGSTGISRRRTAHKGPSFLARSFSLAARVLTWYSIVTILFRCPSTLEACDETSPAICRPYLQIRHAVSPHLEPYYDAYAAPYVDLVRPYYNTLDRVVIAPSWGYASKYGAPRVAQAQAHGKALWETNVQPQLLKYQTSAKARYDQSLAPHISRFSTTVGPYYDVAKTNALQTYYELLLPSYEFIQPYAHQGYRATSAFVTDTAVPSAVWSFNRTYVFLDSTIWPRLRVVYVENVEPQLVKIGQRLGRYNGKTRSQTPVVQTFSSPVSTAASSFTKPAPPASSSSVATSSTTEESSSTPSPETSSVQSTEPSHAAAEPAGLRNSAEQIQAPELEKGEEGNEVRKTAREIVAEDLRDWQERYAKAADEGAAEMEDRVAEISNRMISQSVKRTGKALVGQLQSTVVSDLVALRRDILNIVGAVAKGSASAEAANEQINIVVRRAGMSIKDKAQEVRTWREKYETELQASITTAAQEHFTILDGIRDLAIQKIGMKWAWMDGVTYRDWAKYHQLKGRFDEWQGDLHKLIVSHPALEAAQLEGANIEDEAMALAQSAAKELARLKQVAGWKIVAKDATTEFDSELMKQAAEAVESARAAEEAVDSEVKGRTDNAADTAESVAEAVVGEAASVFEPADASETVVSAAEPVENAASAASESLEASASVVSEPVHSAASVAAESVGSASSIASESLESVSSAGESVASSVSDDVSSFAEEAASPTSKNLKSSASGTISEATEQASSVVEELSKSASSVASSVETAITDDTEELGQDAPDLAAEATAAVLVETPIILGNTTELEEDGPAPVELPVEESEIEESVEEDSEEEDSEEDDTPISSATASVKSAMFGAAAQSVPSREPVFDDDAFDNAASAMKSIRTELPASLASIAESAYSAASSRADQQYSRALSMVSAQIRGTPKPMQEKILASVTSAYSDAMESARSRLDDALRVAREQIGATSTSTNILPTSIPVPTVPTVDWSRVESIAAERLNEGRAWAEEQYESAKIAVGLATPTASTPAELAEKLLDSAKHNYYAGLGVAHARYSEFIEAASAAFSSMTATPTPTDLAGTVSSAASVASESAVSAGGAIADSWDAALSGISAQVYGAPTPTPWYESLCSAASDGATSAAAAAGTHAAAATEEAASRYSAVSSIVSELVAGKEPTFTESVYSRLDAAYSGVAASAVSLAGEAQATASEALDNASEAVMSAGERVASAASGAAEAVRDTVGGSSKDEL